MQGVADGFLQNYSILHELWREGIDVSDGDTELFHMRPKAHMLMHLACDNLKLWGSPSEFWCYGDESACGRIKRIAQKTTHMATIETRIMEKLMVADGLQMYHAEQSVSPLWADAPLSDGEAPA